VPYSGPQLPMMAYHQRLFNDYSGQQDIFFNIYMSIFYVVWMCTQRTEYKEMKRSHCQQRRVEQCKKANWGGGVSFIRVCSFTFSETTSRELATLVYGLRRLFYESALTEHEKAFPNITKTHEKVHKTHSLQRRIDLKIEKMNPLLKTNAKEYHSFT